MWSHSLLNEGFGPLFCLFVCLFVWFCCGKRVSNIAYIKHGGFSVGVVLKVFLVPSLEKYEADMVVLDLSHHYPYDTCARRHLKYPLSSLYRHSSMIRKHQTTKFLPSFTEVFSHSACTHGWAYPPEQTLDLTFVWPNLCVSCSCQAFWCTSEACNWPCWGWPS